MEDLGSICPYVQILDLPVPQMEDPFVDNLNLVDAMDAVRLLDRPISEQVIEVPKFIIDDIPTRTLVPEPQMAEQLVEVPTIISYSSLQRTVEHHVDIPVPGGGGPSSGLQGFLPGQRSTSSPSRKRISERTVEQNVDPFSHGGFPGSSSSRSPAGDEECADEPAKAVFRTFLQNKKSAKVTSHPGSELPPHPSSSTPAPQLEVSVEWVRLKDDKSGKPYYWNRRTFSTVWKPPSGVTVVWNSARNEEGVRYFWHSVTRVSTFDLPPLPPG